VESVRWRRDEREVFVHGDGARIGRDLFDPTAGILSDKSQRGFYVRVLREIPCARKVDRRARGIDVIVALLERSELRRDLMRVTQEEWRSVNQNGFAILGSGLEPQRTDCAKAC